MSPSTTPPRRHPSGGRGGAPRGEGPQAVAALALLALRGLGRAELDTVRGWLETVQRGAEPVAPTVTPVADDDAALLVLYEWVHEWSLVVRKVLKRRGDFTSLGLAEKKSRKAKPGDTPKPDATTPPA